MSNDLDPQRLRRWEIIGFLAIVALVSWDLAVDYAEGVSWGHIAAELVILLIAASGAFVIWRQLKRAREDLVVVRSEANKWQEENRELLQGFSAAIAEQFRRWELTPAESDIGFLLLKGLSHKEIARLRATSERTGRDQGRSVYRKSGLQGRAALSAFFLENIVLPDEG